MLVKFESKAGSFVMFGEVAVGLLKMMGHSGTVPSAIMAEDIPAALQRLESALAARGEEPADAGGGEGESSTSLRVRAFPLLELLRRAAERGWNVQWDKA